MEVKTLVRALGQCGKQIRTLDILSGKENHMGCRCLEKNRRRAGRAGAMPRILELTFFWSFDVWGHDWNYRNCAQLQFRTRKLSWLLYEQLPHVTQQTGEWTVSEKLHRHIPCMIEVQKIPSKMLANQTHQYVKVLCAITKWDLSWECKIGLVWESQQCNSPY